MKRIYLDYAATTPVHPDVLQTMLPYFTESYGNPSSIHYFGQDAKVAMGRARESVAALINARPEEIVFTSGGSEADNLAIKGVAFALEEKGKHIITSAIEHHAVLESLHFLEKRGFRVTYLPVDRYGVVDPRDVEAAIENDTILISIMHANNEVGTIQPIGEIGAIAKQRGVYLHTDAVQTVGHVPIDVNEMNIDLLSTSAHKLYGPKGIGALYVRKGTRLVSLIHGGEQERRRRASTENIPGIVGFGKAAEIALAEMEEESARITALRDRLIEGLLTRIDDARLNGHPTQRLPNNVNVSVKYIEGESMLLNLDMESIGASTGSACSSGTLEPSHVLLALGLSHEEAHGSLRFSLGIESTDEDVDRVLEVLPSIVSKLRAMSPLFKSRA
jgi:cysteine desulfurase